MKTQFLKQIIQRIRNTFKTADHAYLTEALRQSQQQVETLQAVIDGIPASVYWKDVNGVYQGRNRQAFKENRRQGFEFEGCIIGKSDFDLFPHAIAQTFRNHDLMAMSSDEGLTVEEPIITEDGQEVYQLSTKRAIVNHVNNSIIGVVGFTLDITDSKRVEAELREAKEVAQEANRLKTNFIRDMEHDIRTPFTGILGMIEYLYEHETDAQKKEHLSDACYCARELLDYCNSILAFSKINQSTPPLIEKRFSLKKLVEDVARLERLPARQKGIDFKVKFDLPGPEFLIGDMHRLYRILINLVGNAIKFTARGEVGIRVKALSRPAHVLADDVQVVQVSVYDTGMGIPSEKQDVIYEKFVRLKPANENQTRGAGLGLSIVKQFVQDMSGEIEVESIPGHGSCFICKFPFKIPLSNDVQRITTEAKEYL